MSAAIGTGVTDGDLIAELRRAGVDGVDAGARRRSEYASDASLYRVPPRVVATPRGAEQVEACLAVARATGVPITARGAGTSIAGNAVGPGIVIDVRRHLDRIVRLDPERREALVQPGVVLDDLQRAAGVHGLRFGPDPSSHDRCTIGGMVGNNACGTRALGYGRTIDHVLGLEVVDGTGWRGTLGPVADHPASPAGRRALALAVDHDELLATQLDRFPRQVSGYALQHLRGGQQADLARALVGSEGTCALTLRARLRLVPVPGHTVLVVLGYRDMAAAADDVPAVLAHDPVAVEGMDARITAAVAGPGGQGLPALPSGGGWLLVELEGDEPGELRARAQRLQRSAAAGDARLVTDARERAALWTVREAGAGLVSRIGPRPAHAGFEDAAVPVTELGGYLRGFEALLAEHGLSGVPYGHFGDGCVHVRIDLPLGRPDGRVALRRFVTDAARLVVAHGGSLSGEHGDGRARSELLAMQYPQELLELFAAFKACFDPDRVLNPGVLVDPAPLDEDLRLSGQQRALPATGFAYPDDGGDLAAALHRCTGVGRCTATDLDAPRVMCPSYVATRDERDGTRGRARVLQEVVDGDLLPDGLADDAVHDALELCLGCKACASECPTGVDLATYRAEALYQRYRHRRRPWIHHTLGRLPAWMRLLHRLPASVVERLTGPRALRFTARLAGADADGGLPRPARQAVTADPEALLEGRDPSPAAGTVLLWVDSFTDGFSPPVARAAVRVLRDAGLAVRLPDDPGCCGLTWLATGQLPEAARRLRTLLGRLDAALAAAPPGTVLVGLEPSCVAVLRHDARQLLGDDPLVARVSSATRTLAEVLASRRPSWQPPSLAGQRIVAQPHCHQRAVIGWQADRALLTAAGAHVTEVGGCCGLAGEFGMRRGYATISRRIAAASLLPALQRQPAATVLADGFSCRTQVERFGRRPARHLAELLADALDQR